MDRLRTAGISVKAIVAAVILVVCFALFDRIPDPPTVLRNRASSIVVSSHAVPVKEAARLTSSFADRWEFGAVAIFTITLQYKPPKPESLSFWRTAGDSSPPSSSFSL